MANTIVSGASSGLGLAFVLLYASAAEEERHIYAVDQKFPSADAAKTFAGSSKSDDWIKTHVHQYTVDVTSPEEVSGFGMLLDMDDKPVDLLIHCVGVRGLVPGKTINSGADTRKAEALAVMDKATMERTFTVNTVGAFLFLQACVPALKRAADKGSRTPKAMVLGSRMGSVSDNTSGGSYAYRASKAALHTVVKSLNVDVPEAIWDILHPGVVATALVPVKEAGAQEPLEAAGKLKEIIDGLKKKDSGRLIDRFGKDIPW